jgi:hypothetical protein
MFRVPKSKRKHQNDSSPSTQPPVTDYSHLLYESPTKRSRKALLPNIYVANGKRYIQQTGLPIPRGQVGLLNQTGRWHEDNEISKTKDLPLNSEIAVPIPLHSQKRIAQMERWRSEILPILIQPYMEFKRVNQNHNVELAVQPDTCSCGKIGRVLPIIVVRAYSEYTNVISGVNHC